MNTHSFDFTIAGAGLVGLASAWALKARFPGASIAILEKEAGVAAHQSGHNSGVIHSGIYYKPGSLRARHCFRGYEQLIDFSREHGVPFDLCGKLIVAVDEQESQILHNILARGQAHGMQGLQWLDGGQARKVEPHVACRHAILVPQTGIIDYPALARTLQDLLREKGVIFHFNTRVQGIELIAGSALVTTPAGTFSSAHHINCAGLYADHLARFSHPDLEMRILPFRGEYYQLRPEKEKLVRNLIYPVPHPAFPFLGVHFTRMQRGGIEAGPNAVFAWRREGYGKTDIHWGELGRSLAFPGTRRLLRKYWRFAWQEYRRSFHKGSFVKSLQRMLPELQASDLLAAHSGVRAMAVYPNGEMLDDYLVLQTAAVTDVVNAPSPAATSCFAIGEDIAGRIASATNTFI